MDNDDLPVTARFFRDDPDEDVLGFVNAWAIGDKSAGVLLNGDGEIVVSNGGRDRFAVVLETDSGTFCVHSYVDALRLIDPEGLPEDSSDHPDVGEAFAAACLSVGCPVPGHTVRP